MRVWLHKFWLWFWQVTFQCFLFSFLIVFLYRISLVVAFYFFLLWVFVCPSVSFSLCCTMLSFIFYGCWEPLVLFLNILIRLMQSKGLIQSPTHSNKQICVLSLRSPALKQITTLILVVRIHPKITHIWILIHWGAGHSSHHSYINVTLCHTKGQLLTHFKFSLLWLH